MWIITINLANHPISQENTLIVHEEYKISECINHLLKKYPAEHILVFKLTEKYVSKVTYETTKYIFTDKGELLPA